jgi:hypothetical protein
MSGNEKRITRTLKHWKAKCCYKQYLHHSHGFVHMMQNFALFIKAAHVSNDREKIKSTPRQDKLSFCKNEIFGFARTQIDLGKTLCITSDNTEMRIFTPQFRGIFKSPEIRLYPVSGGY